MMRKCFDRYVTPHGEWLESTAHYAHVSAGDLLSFAVAAKQAGYHDFFAEKAMQRLGRFLAQEYTPRDPRHYNRRATPPVGRGTAGMAWGHFGVFARATEKIAPEFSAHMQWMWGETNYASGLVKMGGFQDLYGDRTLPERKPEWGTVRFPNVSVVFRNGLGAREHYLNYLAVSDTFGTVHKQEVGNIAAWFAYGKPVSMRFGSNNVLYSYMRRLMNQVTPAWDQAQGEDHSLTTKRAEHTGFARLPSADYASARYTLGKGKALNMDRLWEGLPEWPDADQTTGKDQWERQIMFLRSESSAEQHYLLINDTILNDQPTRWHFWTLSRKLGATNEATSDGFLGNAPGNAPASAGELQVEQRLLAGEDISNSSAPARELNGDRFTARGQYDVDLDFFVAEPTDTPRHTMRYGGSHREYAVNLTEFQDVLHLQNPGKGRYYVAIVPRSGETKPAQFERLADGQIIRVVADSGTDYLLLSREPVQAVYPDKGIAFDTAAGAIRERENGFALILHAPGSLKFEQTTLLADGPAQLGRKDGGWVVTVEHGDVAHVWNVRNWEKIHRRTIEPMEVIQVEIRYPDAAGWKLHDLPNEVELERREDAVVLTIPREVSEIRISDGE